MDKMNKKNKPIEDATVHVSMEINSDIYKRIQTLEDNGYSDINKRIQISEDNGYNPVT